MKNKFHLFLSSFSLLIMTTRDQFSHKLYYYKFYFSFGEEKKFENWLRFKAEFPGFLRVNFLG